MSDGRQVPDPDGEPPAGPPAAAPPGEPASTGEPAVPPRAKRGRRLVVLGVIAIALAVGAWLTLRRAAHRGGPAPVAGSGDHDGKAAVHAPAPPALVDRGPGGVRLTGTVVDTAGAPVVGAEVSAELERGVPDRALASHPVAAADVTADGGPSPDAASAPPDAGAPTIITGHPTGPDGRFAIEGLTAGRYRLRVDGPGLLAAELRYVPVPSDEARLIVARQVAIDGRVVDGGHPAPGVRVSIRGEALGGTLEVKTEADGGFHVPRLPEGSYQVWAGQGALAARAIRVVRIGAGPFAPVELALEPGAIVVGRVVDRDEGTGLVAAVELRPVAPDEAPRYARSGDDGVFRIDGLPTGRWLADAVAPGYLSPGALELEAGRGVPELALIGGATIEGRVVDGAGQPIAGATVRARSGGGRGPELSAEVEADRLRLFAGQLAPASPSSSGGAAGAAGGFAGDPAFEARGELGVLRGPIPPIPPPGTLTRQAAIVDAPWRGGTTGATPGLVAEPAPLRVDPARASIFVTGADGRYRIRGLPRGAVVAFAALPGLADGRSKPVEVGPGEVARGVDVVLTAGVYVIGQVADQHGAAVVGATITVTPEDGPPIEVQSDGDGRYRVGPLAGRTTLRGAAFGHDVVERALTLAPPPGPAAGEQREDLVLAVADAVIAGVITDDDGVPVDAAEVAIVGGAGDGRRATSARDGTFRIEQLPPGHVHARVIHGAYPPIEADLTARSIVGPPGPAAALRLSRGGGVEGALLDDARGEVLPGVTIRGRGPGDARAEATTDKAGQWKLAPLVPGGWRLEVKQPGFLPASREVTVPGARYAGGTSVRDVRIDLRRGALLGGTVRDRAGNRVARAHVTVRAADGATAEGQTDDAGEFRIRDCPTGAVEVAAAAGDRRGATTVTVRAGDEVLTLGVEVR